MAWLVFLLLTPTILSSGLEIKEPEPVIRPTGENVTLYCRGLHELRNTPSVLEWFKIEGNESLLLSQWNNSYPDLDNADIPSALHLVDVTLDDSGKYECRGQIFTSDSNTSYPFKFEVVLEVHEPPKKPPGKPMVEVLGARELMVSWKTHEEEESPITGYKIIVSHDGKSYYSYVEGNINSTVLQSLEPYTMYVITVEARNGVGYSPPGDPSDPVQTKEEAPKGSPEVDSNVVGSTTIVLYIKPPLHSLVNGQLRGYVMRHQISGESPHVDQVVADPNITNHTFSGLKPFTMYIVGVGAYNDAGMGPFYTIALKTKEGVPDAPRITGFRERTQNMLHVMWEKPVETRGSLTHYLVYWSLTDSNVTHHKKVPVTNGGDDVMDTIIDGLEPYTDYELQVSGCTSQGEGQRSSIYPGLTDVDAPSKPNIINVTVNSSSSVIIFFEPPAEYTKHIAHYNVSYRPLDVAGYQSLIYNPDGLADGRQEAAISGLTPGRQYEVKVAGVSSSRFGEKNILGDYSQPWQFELMATTPKPPDLTIGILAGVVCTGIVLVMIIILFVLLRRYLRSRYRFASDPDSTQLNAALSLPEAYDPVDCIRDAVPVEQFAEHVFALHVDGELGFSQEYEDINKGTQVDVPANACHDSENKHKNRYLNIAAYDHSRVILKPIASKARSDYINANFVDGYHKARAYIAAQGPLPSTFSDFWRMVWEQNSSVVVMITNLTERGRRKCDQYWPSEGEHQYDHMWVRLLNTYIMAHYTIRVFILRHLKHKKRPGHERVIVQYHYTDWPDHGVPEYTLPSLTFIRRSAAAGPETAGPIIVHCSAGVGRTGTYIVIDSMMRQIKDKNSINIYGFLSHIRKQRNFLVQTEDQYIFTHDALLEYLKSGDTEVKAAAMARYLRDLLATDADGNSLLKDQFKLVTEFRPKDYHLASALLEVNSEKHRKMNLLPVEASRVRLPTQPGVEGSDYINASYLQGYNQRTEFIVTQHPLKSTVEDFWRMVWDKNSMTIVLLSSAKDEELGAFWPSKEETMDCGHFKVTFTEDNHQLDSVTSDFLLQSTQDDYECTTRIICSTFWPESCLPLMSVFDLIRTVKDWHSQHEEVEGPIIVVDRYGGAESGTFCALYTLYDQLYHEGCVDVYMTAKLYHLKRPGIFPSEERLRFLYASLETLCTSDTTIPLERDLGLCNAGLLRHSANMTLPLDGQHGHRASSRLSARLDVTTM